MNGSKYAHINRDFKSNSKYKLFPVYHLLWSSLLKNKNKLKRTKACVDGKMRKILSKWLHPWSALARIRCDLKRKEENQIQTFFSNHITMQSQRYQIKCKTSTAFSYFTHPLSPFAMRNILNWYSNAQNRCILLVKYWFNHKRQLGSWIVAIFVKSFGCLFATNNFHFTGWYCV